MKILGKRHTNFSLFNIRRTLVLCAVLFCAAGAFGVGYEWTGGAGDNNWITPSNWNLGIGYPDGADDTAIFGTGVAAPTVTLPAGLTVEQITADVAVVLTTGTTLTIGIIDGTGSVTATDTDVTVPDNAASAISVTGGVSFKSLNAQGTIAISTNITTSGTQAYDGAVTLTGPSSLSTTNQSISFANTITETGGLTVAVGSSSITFADNQTLSALTITSANTVNIGASAFNVSGTLLASSAIEINGAGAISVGTLTANGAVSIPSSTSLTATTISGAGSVMGASVALSLDNSTVSVDGDIEVSSVNATGTANLSTNITTTGGQTYDGMVTIAAGGVELNAGVNTIQFNSIVSGGVLTLASASGVTFNGAVTSDVTFNNSTTLSGTGTLSNITVASGTLTLGDELQMSGNLIATTGMIIPNTNAITFSGTSTLETSSVLADIIVTSGTLTLESNVSAANVRIDTGATLDTDNFNLTASGTLTNDGTFTTTGGATSATTVAGSGSWNLAGTVTTTGAGGQTYGGTVTIGGSGATLNAGSSDISFGSGIVLNSNLIIETSGDVSVTGEITGTGTLTINNANTVTFNGNVTRGVTFNGTTNLNATGTLSDLTVASGTLMLGSNISAANVRVDAGATLNTSSYDLNASGTITNNGIFTTTDGTITATSISGLGSWNLAGTVTTTGAGGQTYTGTVTLSGATTLDSGTNSITFGGAVTGGQDLTVTNASGVSFAGDVTAGALAITATTGTTFTDSAINVGTFDILSGTTSFSGNSSLTATTIASAQAVSVTGGNFTLNSPISATSFSSAASTTTEIGANITTTGGQSYSGAVTIGGTGVTTLDADASNISFGNGITLNQALNLNTTGDISVTGAVSGGQDLTITAANQVSFAGDVTAGALAITATTETSFSDSAIDVTTFSVTSGTTSFSGTSSITAATSANLQAVTVASGTLTLNSNVTATSVTLANGSALATGANTLTAPTTISGSATVSGNITGDVVIPANVEQTLTLDGNLTITGNLNTHTAGSEIVTLAIDAHTLDISGFFNATPTGGTEEATIVVTGTGNLSMGSFDTTQTGTHTLTAPDVSSITVSTEFWANVDTGTALLSITLDAQKSTINLNSEVYLGGNTNATLTIKGKTINFNNTVSTYSDTKENGALVVEATTVTFVNTVGADDRVFDTLTVTAPTININGGSVITTGAQTYKGKVQTTAATLILNASADADTDIITFAGDVTATALTLTASQVTFDGSITAERTITVTSGLNNYTGDIKINTAVGQKTTFANGFTQISSGGAIGDVSLQDTVVATNNGLSFSGATTLEAATTLTATNANIAFAGEVTGAQNLSLSATGGTGIVTFANNVGTPDALTGITVTNTAEIIFNKNLSVNTTFSIPDTAHLQFISPTANQIVSLPSSSIALGATGELTIEAPPTAGTNATIFSKGITQTGDSGSINLEGNITATAGGLNFAGNITSSGATHLTATGTDGQVSFGGDMDFTSSNLSFDTLHLIFNSTDAQSITTPSVLTFTGAVDILAGATTTFSKGFSQTGSGAVTLSGNITSTADNGFSFNGATTLTGNTIITATNQNVTFGATIKNGMASGSHAALSIDADTGTITHKDGIGQKTTAPADATSAKLSTVSLTADSIIFTGGVASGNGGMYVRSTDTQIYAGAVTLSPTDATGSSNGVRFNAATGDISFSSTIEGINPLITDYTSTLALYATNGDIILKGAITGIDYFETSIFGAGKSTQLKGSSISSTNHQRYTGPVTLGNENSLTSTNSSISFSSTITGAQILNLDAGNTITVSGNVGEAGTPVTSLKAVNITDATTVNINANFYAGDLNFTGDGIPSNISFTPTAAQTINVPDDSFSTITGAVTIAATDTNTTTFTNGFTQNASGGTVSLAGTVTAGANGLSFSGATTLTGNTTLNANNQTITLAGTINSEGSETNSLTLGNTAEVTTVNLNNAIGATQELSSLSINADAINISSAEISTTGNQNYGTTGTGDGNIVLNADTTTLGAGTGSISFKGTINADTTAGDTEILTITDAGTVTFGGIVGTTPLTALSVTATNIEINGNITTNGALTVSPNNGQYYNGAVTLGNNITFTSNNKPIEFDGAVNGVHTLTIQAGTSTVSFDGGVGTDTAAVPTGLIANAATINIGAAGVTTNGNQDYNGDVKSASATKIAAGSSGNISFANDVNITGDLTISGSAYIFDGSTDQTVTANNQLSLSGKVTKNTTHTLTVKNGFLQTNNVENSLNGIIKATNSNLIFGGTVKLTGNTTFDSGTGTTQFGRTINASTSGVESLTVTNAGHLWFRDPIGNTVPLSTLTGTATTITLDAFLSPNPGSITTIQGQTYNGPVTLGTEGTDLTLSSTGDGDILFSSTIDGAKNLSIDTDANIVTFTGAVGATTELSSLSVNATTINVNGGSVATSGDQTYGSGASNGNVVLAENTAFTAENTATIAFKGALEGDVDAGTDVKESLAISGADTATFGGEVSNVSTVDVSASTINVNGGGVTSSGAQTFAGATAINIDSTTANSAFTADTGDISFTGPIALDEETTITAAAQDILFNTATTTIQGATTLNLDAERNITFDGNVGPSGARLTEVDIKDAQNVIFNADFYATDLNFESTTGTSTNLIFTSPTLPAVASQTIDVTNSQFSNVTGEITMNAPATTTGHSLAFTKGFNQNALSTSNIYLKGVIVDSTGGGFNFSSFANAILIGNTILVSQKDISFPTLTGAFSLFIHGEITNPLAITPSTPATNVTFNNTIGTTPLSSLTVFSTNINLNAGSVTTTGAQSYTGTTTFDKDTAIKTNTADVTFNGALNATTATRTLNVGTNSASVGAFSVTGAAGSNIGTFNVYASTGISFGNTLILGGETIFNTSGGNIGFTGAVNGNQTLDIDAIGSGSAVNFASTVGNTNPLKVLNVNASGAVSFANSLAMQSDGDLDVKTTINTGNISFGGNTTLGTDTDITSNAGNTTFSGTVNSTFGTLDVSAPTGISFAQAAILGSATTLTATVGNISFGVNATIDGSSTTDSLSITGNQVNFGNMVGNTNPLKVLNVNASGAVSFANSLAMQSDGDLDVKTTIDTGNISFGGNTTLGTDTDITSNAGNTTFSGTVNSTFGTLDVSAPAGISFAQAVTLGSATSLTANTGNVNFDSVLDGTSGTSNLSIPSANKVAFSGAVGSINALKDITITANEATEKDAVVFSNTLDASGNVSITATRKSIQFNDIVGGSPASLTVTVGENIRFNKSITAENFTFSASAADNFGIEFNGDVTVTNLVATAGDIYITGASNFTTNSGTANFPKNLFIVAGAGNPVVFNTPSNLIVNNNFVLFTGDVTLGTSLTTNEGDVVLFGKAPQYNGDYNKPSSDPDALGPVFIEGLFRYNPPSPFVRSSQTNAPALIFPLQTPWKETPIQQETTGGFAGTLADLVGKTITVGKNFYANGINLQSSDAANTWTLNLPDNNNATSTFAEAYNATIQNTTVAPKNAGEFAWLSAAENVINNGGNTNVAFARPLFRENNSTLTKNVALSGTYTITDDMVRVEFKYDNGTPSDLTDDTIALIENSNNEISKAFSRIKTNTGGIYENGFPFSGVFSNPEGTETTDGKGDLSAFYLRVSQDDFSQRWNTDATGTHSSKNNTDLSTDMGRGVSPTHRDTIPNIHIPIALSDMYETLRDQYKNRIATVSYTETDDRCSPVLIEAYTGQELHGNASLNPDTLFPYDAHNFVELVYSEEIEITGVEKSATNIRATANFGHVASSSNGINITGIANITEGALSTGTIDGNEHVNALYRNYSIDGVSAPIEHTNRVRISIAGFVDASNPHTYDINEDGTPETHHNWVGHIIEAVTPSGTITPIAGVTDATSTKTGVDTTISRSFSNPGNNLYTGWDTSPPVLAKFSASMDSWTDDSIEKEILAYSDTLFMKNIEIHFFDNTPSYEETERYKWISTGTERKYNLDGWFDNGTLIQGSFIDTYGGSRFNEARSAIPGEGGIRSSSLVAGYASLNITLTDGGVPQFDGFSQRVKSSFLLGEPSSYPSSITARPGGIDTPYVSLNIAASEYDTYPLYSNLNITYDGTQPITDLAGNKMKNIEPGQASSIYFPYITLTIAPIGSKEMFILFSTQMETTSSVLSAIPKSLSLDSSVVGSLSIDQTIPAKVVADTELGTGYIITLTEEVSYENIVASAPSALGGETIAKPLSISGTEILRKDSSVFAVTSGFPLSIFAINAITPLYAYDEINFGQNTFGDGFPVTRIFDGSGVTGNTILADKDITLEFTAIPEGETNSITEKIAINMSVNPSENSVSVDYNTLTGLNSRVWLPSVVGTISGTANTNIKRIDDIDSNAGEINIPVASDYEWTAGDQLQFLFELPNKTLDHDNNIITPPIPLYALRLKDKQDPLSIDVWSLDIEDIVRQRGNVTIVNNVINVNVEEKARLEVNMPQDGTLSIHVLTLDGNIVKTLHRGRESQGIHYYEWDGKNGAGNPVARGMYFVRVVGPGIDETRKVMAVKE